ncbi:MAG: glycosyltransferase family 39 protein [Thermodesulfobacteriota bacterium]
MRSGEKSGALLHALILLAVGAAMVSVSWLKWPDILIDFGREVYVPWQLAEGKVLYRDIFYFNGPFSPYLNSLLFRLFGESILIIEAFNILAIAGITYLIYRLFSEKEGDSSALLVCICFLTVFAFSQYGRVGNSNFVTPYSNEITHGMLVSLLSIWFFRLYLKERGCVWLALVGFCLGLLFVTKIEIFLAAFTAVSSGLLLVLWYERPGGREALKEISVMGFAFILPAGAFLAYLSLYMRPEEALRGIFGPWVMLATTDVGSTQFYRTVRGTDRILFNLKQMMSVAALYFGWFSLIAAVNHMLGKIGGPFRRRGLLISFAVTMLLLVGFSSAVPWLKILRPLPIVTAIIGVVLLARLVRGRESGEARERDIMRFVIAVFSFMLLLKVLLNIDIRFYGFALAMPAALLTVKALVAWVPSYLNRVSGYSVFFRWAALTTIAVMVVWHLTYSVSLYRLKGFAMGSGGDTVVGYNYKADLKGTHDALVADVLEEIEKIMGPEDSFVALPEGLMLNYLSRRLSPTGFLTFVPANFVMFGEERMLAAFEERPPDYVLMVHRDTSEYGYEFFGRDYGLKLYSWATDNYEPVSQIGATPFQGKDFGVLIMRRAGERGRLNDGNFHE